MGIGKIGNKPCKEPEIKKTLIAISDLFTWSIPSVIGYFICKYHKNICLNGKIDLKINSRVENKLDSLVKTFEAGWSWDLK